MTVSESDSWLKKASLLISSDRKNSLDILNHHIQLSETINMSPNCPELVELKKIVKEINQWVVKKNEIFSNYSKTCTLMDFSVAQQLSESYHWAFRANDFILLEQQMKKVLKIEKALRSLRDDSPTQRGASLRSVTDSDESRDDPLGAFNDSGLKDTDGSTNSCSKVSARSESSEREKISHSEDDINSSYTLNTGDDSTIRSSTIVHTGDISNNCDEGDRCDRPVVLPSLILPVSLSSASASSCIQGPPHQTIIFQKKILVKTKLSVHNESTTEEDDDIRGRGDGCGKQEKSVDVSFISSNAVLVFENGRDYMGVNTSPCEESDADFKTNRGGSSSMAGNESNGNIKVTSSGKIDTDSRNPSSLTDHSDMKLDQNCKLAKVHWNNLMSLFKDVVSVLPLRCIGVEILLSLYHSVNVWTKRYIGGILHHCSFASLYSRVPSLIDPIPPILPSVPLLLNSEEESLPGLLHPRTSNSTDACPLSSSISSKTSTSVQNASVSKSVSMKNVQQKVPGHSLINAIDCVASQYSERTPACEVFAAETFLEFRVGLFMERMAAISSTNTVNEVNSSAVMASSSVPSTSASSVPSLPSSGSVDPTDILCFCRMPAAMGETPVLSQCDSCDRWYHPNCVNAALVSQSASRSSDSFLCPLCLHMQGRHSNFAYKPFSEWKIIRNAGSGSLKKKPIVTTTAAAAASKITTATSAAGSSKEDKKGTKAIVHAASSNGLIGKRLSDKELLAESKRVRTKVTASSKSAIRTNTDSDLDSVRKVGTNAPVLCTSFDRGKSSTDCSGDISAIQCGERVYDFPLPHDSLETVFSRRHEQYDPNGSNEYQQEVSATLQINSIEENLNSICLLSDSITENDITFSLVRSETLSDIKLESLNIEGTFDLPDGRISSDVSLGLLTSSPNLEDSLSLPRDKNPATAATDSLSAPSLSKTSLVAKTKALSSTGRKGIKVTSPRPASDPLSSEDLRDAIKAERVLTVSQVRTTTTSNMIVSLLLLLLQLLNQMLTNSLHILWYLSLSLSSTLL